MTPPHRDLDLASRYFAAPDANAVTQPGQRLLQQLERPRAATSKETVFKAASAVLTDAKPQHAISSEVSVFGQPDAETRYLQTFVAPDEPLLVGIAEMVASKAERHHVAWETYLERRDICGVELREAVEGVTAGCKDELSALDEAIQEEASQLEDSSLMVLDEHNVMGIWDAIAGALASRVAAVERCREGLVAAEGKRRAMMEQALMQAFVDLVDVAFIGEGEAERLVEQEALQLNTEMLRNRRAFADLHRRMRAAEVAYHKAIQEQWEEGMERWRALRTAHAIATFVARIESPEFAEPSTRVQMLSQLRRSQQDHLAALLEEIRRVRQALDPHLSTDAADKWHTEAQNLCDAWEASVGEAIDALYAHEQALEEQVQALKADLVAEVRSFGFLITDQAIEERLDKDVEPVLHARRDAADLLLSRSDVFLTHQARQWRVGMGAMGRLLQEVATSRDDHVASLSRIETKVRQLLGLTRQAFEESDTAAEAALEEAVERIRQGHDKPDLDRLVLEALQHLSNIEESYRDFYTNMVNIVEAHPLNIKKECDRYHRALTEHLGLRPLLPPESPPATGPVEAPTPEVEAADSQPPSAASRPEEAKPPESERGKEAAKEAKGGKGSGRPSSSKKEKSSSGALSKTPSGLPGAPSMAAATAAAAAAAAQKAAEEAAARAAAAVEEAKEALVASVVLPGEEEFDCTADLFIGVFLQAVGKADRDMLQELAAQHRTIRQSLAEGAEATGGVDLPTGKEGLPGRPASGGSNAGNVPEGESASMLEIRDARDPPLLSDGSPALLVSGVPEEPVRLALLELQGVTLQEMLRVAKQQEKESRDWAFNMDVQLTDELDENLRRHKPRAGRIEEGVREARAVELLGQKRSVDLHLRAMGRAIVKQMEAFTKHLLAERAKLDRMLGQLRTKRDALRVDLSVQAVEVREREGKAIMSAVERALVAIADALSTEAESDAQGLTGMNSKFSRTVLVGFAEGGRFAESNLVRYRARLTDCDTVIRLQMNKEIEMVKAMREEVSQLGAQHVQELSEAAVVHKEDLKLIETLDKAVQSTSSRARGLFDGSKAHEGRIAEALKTLGKLLRRSPADADKEYRRKHEGPKLALEGSRGGLELSQEILDAANVLRVLLCSRSAVLEAFRPGTAVPVRLHRPWVEGESATAPFDDDGDVDDSENKWVRSLLSAEQLMLAERDHEGSSLRERVEALLKACADACDPVCKEYYAKRDPSRAITRPNRISETLEGMNDINSKFLAEIRAQFAAHQQAALHVFSDQTIAATRLLLQVPGACCRALVFHEAREYERQHNKKQAWYADMLRQLRNELVRHRADIRPQLADPSRQDDIDQLVEDETTRTESAVDTLKARARDAVKFVQQMCARARTRLGKLVQAVMRIIDGTVMPEDLASHGRIPKEAVLPDVPEQSASDTGATASRARMNIKQLHRLALAQAQVSGVEAEEALREHCGQGRSFKARRWTLGAGPLVLEALGWSKEDAETVADADEDDNEDGEDGKAGTGDARECQGMDTPIHRASVRAYEKALEALAEVLRQGTRESVSDVRAKLRTALQEEEMFRRQFNNLINSLQASLG